MMKWKVTKNSRSSSVDRSVEWEYTDGTDVAKFLPAAPGLPKAEQVMKHEDVLLPPPTRRKQQQNGSFGLSRKDSFAATDCIPLNLKEILGISRQRSESSLSSLPVLNGERKRSRSEIRISSTDRLSVAYHGCQLNGPQKKLTERNPPKADKLPVPNGRCPSPPMKNSRWLRGRQRQREPKKTMLGVCGGVNKNGATKDKITNEITAPKDRSGSEINGPVNTLVTDIPKQIPEEVNDKGKAKSSKDVNLVTSSLNGEAEKELDKENIKTIRKPPSEGGKQCKEGHRFRRNKGFAPRPGMRRSQNENGKNSNGFEDEANNKTDRSKNCAQNTTAEIVNHHDELNRDRVVHDSQGSIVNKESDCKTNDSLDFPANSSSEIPVTQASEHGNETKLFNVTPEKITGNKTVDLNKNADGQSCDFVERNNERNNECSVADKNKPEIHKPQVQNLENLLANVDNGVSEHNINISEEGGFKPSKTDLCKDDDNVNMDLRVKQDKLTSPVRQELNDIQDSESLSNIKEENIYENIRTGGFTAKEFGLCTAESKDGLAETMLDSLAIVEEQSDYIHIPMDTCSQGKVCNPETPPPKKKLASHKGMTVSVVVRKPSTSSEECAKPLTRKEPEVSNSKSFVMKKSFVLTIAKQEMGFRSMCANKESSVQTHETTPAGVKKEEQHQISVTFLCSGNVNKSWMDRQTSSPPINDFRLRSLSMPPISRHQQQDLLSLESIRSRSRERRNREKQNSKRKNHRQRKKDPGFHMPKAVIDELSKVLEKRKRSIEDDEDDSDEYQEDDSD